MSVMPMPTRPFRVLIAHPAISIQTGNVSNGIEHKWQTWELNEREKKDEALFFSYESNWFETVRTTKDSKMITNDFLVLLSELELMREEKI